MTLAFGGVLECILWNRKFPFQSQLVIDGQGKSIVSKVATFTEYIIR